MKRVALLASVLLVSVFVSFPQAHGLSLGSANVDGIADEWSVADFYANMHRAGDPNKVVESKLYLRYNCLSQTLYVLVLAEGGISILTQPEDSYVKIDGPSALVDGSIIADGIAPDFAWIGLNPDGTSASGWEASVSLAPGVHMISVHTQVYNDNESQTSSTTAGSSNQRFIPLVVECATNPVESPLFDIGGVVFIDSNQNQQLDNLEPGFIHTMVYLFNANGQIITSVAPDASGRYLFENLPIGSYSVQSVILNSLAEYFSSTTPVILFVELVSSDSLGNYFGLIPNTTVIVTDFDPNDTDGNGIVFSGTGKTIGFWKHQLQTHLSGKGNAQVDPITLQGYLDSIESLYLPQPFQFDDANEFRSALDILNRTSSQPVDLLLKQLLATELNEVSNRGLNEPYRTLQQVLIAWGESLAAGASQDDAMILFAKDIMDAINNSGE